MHRLDGPDTICRITTPPKGKSYPFYMELQQANGTVLQVRSTSQEQLQSFVDIGAGVFLQLDVETDEVQPPYTPPSGPRGACACSGPGRTRARVQH